MAVRTEKAIRRRKRRPYMGDTFRQIGAAKVAEIKVKGSRFIAEALPATSEAEAQDLLQAIRKREYNATHHCWAYRIGQDGALFRYSDDGEPSGTAGQPILRHIDGREVTNLIVVVTRYYGGTKLGTGGLIRAYGDAASAVLERCKVETHIIRTHLRVIFDYADTSPAMHTIDNFDVVIEDSIYGDDTTLIVAVRQSEVEAFTAQFTENLAGRGRVASAG